MGSMIVRCIILIYITYNNAVYIAQKTQRSCYMLFRVIIAVYCEDCTTKYTVWAKFGVC